MKKLNILILLLILDLNDGRRMRIYRRSHPARQFSTNPGETYDTELYEEFIRSKIIKDIMELNGNNSQPTVGNSPTENLSFEVKNSPLYVTVDPITGKKIMQVGNATVDEKSKTYPDVQVVNSNLAPIKTAEPPEMTFSNEGAVNNSNIRITIKLPTHPVVEKLNEYLKYKQEHKNAKPKVKKVKPIRIIPSEDHYKMPQFRSQYSNSPNVEYYYYPTQRPKRNKHFNDQLWSESRQTNSDDLSLLASTPNGEQKTVLLKRITDTDYINYLKSKQDQRFKDELMEKYKILSVPRTAVNNKKYRVVNEDNYSEFSSRQPNSLPSYTVANFGKGNRFKQKGRPTAHGNDIQMMKQMEMMKNMKDMKMQSSTTEASTQGEIPEKLNESSKMNTTMSSAKSYENSTEQAILSSTIVESTTKPGVVQPTQATSETKELKQILKDLQSAVTVEKAKVHQLDINDETPGLTPASFTTTPKTNEQLKASPEMSPDTSMSFDSWKPIFYNRTEYVREFYYPSQDPKRRSQDQNNGKNNGHPMGMMNGNQNDEGYVYKKGNGNFEEGANFNYDQHRASSNFNREMTDGMRMNDSNQDEYYKRVYNNQHPSAPRSYERPGGTNNGHEQKYRFNGEHIHCE